MAREIGDGDLGAEPRGRGRRQAARTSVILWQQDGHHPRGDRGIGRILRAKFHRRVVIDPMCRWARVCVTFPDLTARRRNFTCRRYIMCRMFAASRWS
jgi:hypothetical protein